MTVQKVIEVIRGKELTPPIRPTNFELKYAFLIFSAFAISLGGVF